jgi:hypothetical protein
MTGDQSLGRITGISDIWNGSKEAEHFRNQALMHLRSNLVVIFARRALSLSRSLLSIARMPGVSHRSSPNGATGIWGTSFFQDDRFYHRDAITASSVRLRKACTQVFWP